MRKTILALAATVLAATPGALVAAEPGWAWKAPKPAALQDADAAITVAHAYWKSMHPQSKVGTAEEWHETHRATLFRGTWEVAEKTWTDTHGAFVIYIDAQDGRLLRATYVD